MSPGIGLAAQDELGSWVRHRVGRHREVSRSLDRSRSRRSRRPLAAGSPRPVLWGPAVWPVQLGQLCRSRPRALQPNPRTRRTRVSSTSISASKRVSSKVTVSTGFGLAARDELGRWVRHLVGRHREGSHSLSLRGHGEWSKAPGRRVPETCSLGSSVLARAYVVGAPRHARARHAASLASAARRVPAPRGHPGSRRFIQMLKAFLPCAPARVETGCACREN